MRHATSVIVQLAIHPRVGLLYSPPSPEYRPSLEMRDRHIIGFAGPPPQASVIDKQGDLFLMRLQRRALLFEVDLRIMDSGGGEHVF